MALKKKYKSTLLYLSMSNKMVPLYSSARFMASCKFSPITRLPVSIV